MHLIIFKKFGMLTPFLLTLPYSVCIAAAFNNLGTSPDDFSFTPATTSVNFPNTAVQGNVQCITVAGIQDAIGEETETLLVNIADDTAVPPVFEVDGAVAGFSAFVQIDVTDDDSK